MTLRQQLAALDAQRAAAVALLARSCDTHTTRAAWATIAWCEAQARRLLLTAADEDLEPMKGGNNPQESEQPNRALQESRTAGIGVPAARGH